MINEIKDRMEGCLLGVFCGDALGAPIEFKDPEQVSEKYPHGLDDMVDGWGGMDFRQKGSITDDSEMTVALLGSLVKCKGFCKDDVLRAYHAWLKTEPLDVGKTIGEALLCRTSNPDSEANGALMRISPVALYAVAHSGWDWAGAAEADAALTHVNPKCAAANVIYVESLILAMQGMKPVDIHARALCRSRDLQQPELTRLLELAATEEPDYWTNKGWLHHAFQATYYWLLHATDFRSALLAVVNKIGDPDTNGAIVGAMLGAVYGRYGIPEDWIDTLRTAESRTAEFDVSKGLSLLAELTRN